MTGNAPRKQLHSEPWKVPDNADCQSISISPIWSREAEILGFSNRAIVNRAHMFSSDIARRLVRRACTRAACWSVIVRQELPLTQQELDRWSLDNEHRALSLLSSRHERERHLR